MPNEEFFFRFYSALVLEKVVSPFNQLFFWYQEDVSGEILKFQDLYFLVPAMSFMTTIAPGGRHRFRLGQCDRAGH